MYISSKPLIFSTYPVSEIFGWYIGGGRLALLPPNAEKDPAKIMETIKRQQVSHINFVPAMFSAFLDTLEQKKFSFDSMPSLSYLFLAGEALPPSSVSRFRAFNSRVQLENLYGPTESTVYASAYSLHGWRDGMPVPIGKPLQNISLYIMSQNLGLQPIGIPGELCIAGDGLAMGYLNRPELTAASFVGLKPQITQISQILYKTGDGARWLPDGNIEFLGRIDQQVKIRGYRIELGEIESLLMLHPDVNETVVLNRNDNNRHYLCAYVVWKKRNEFQVLKDWLKSRVPEYMLPASFVELETIPLTASGKIARKQLPEPTESGTGTAGAFEAPETGLQQTIANVWKEVLGREKIGITDNFFDIGGNSLDFVKISNKLEERLNEEVPVDVLFTYPSIHALEIYLTGNREDQSFEENAAEDSEMLDEGKDLMRQAFKDFDDEEDDNDDDF